MKKRSKITLLLVGVILCSFYLMFKTEHQSEQFDNLIQDSPYSSSQHETAELTTSLASVNNNEDGLESLSKPPTDSNYIVACDTTQILDYVDMSNPDVFATYQTSLSEQKRLAYALYSNIGKDTNRLDRLISFNRSFPENVIALEQLLGLCTEVKEHPNCNHELVDKATSVGGDNAAMWFAIASFHASRDEFELVKDAFRQINSAPIYEESYADYISLYVNSLQGRPNENFSINALSAFGAVAAQPSFFNIISMLCTGKPSEDEEFLQLCLSLGKTMEVRGKTNLTQMIGRAYQEVVYDLENNERALQDLDHTRAAMTYDLALFNKAADLMLFDQRFFHNWLRNLRHLGEQSAAKLAVEEAIELSKNPYYKPCS